MSNASDIVVRNQNDNADLNVISFDASANMIIGSATMPFISFVSQGQFNFNGPIITSGASLSIGTNPALAGAVRLPNLGDIQFRNAANDGNIAALSVDGSDVLQLGAGVTTVNIPAAITTTGNITTTDNIFTIGDGGGDSKIQFLGCTDFFLAVNASPEEIAFGSGTSVTQALTDLGIAGAEINFRLRSANGQNLQFRRATASTVAMTSGSSVTISGIIPTGVHVLAVTARVTTEITGPAGFDLGDGSTVDRWGNSIAVAAGTTVDISDYVADGFGDFPSGSDIVLTSDGVDFTAGVVAVTVFYYQVIAPTS